MFSGYTPIITKETNIIKDTKDNIKDIELGYHGNNNHVKFKQQSQGYYQYQSQQQQPHQQGYQYQHQHQQGQGQSTNTAYHHQQYQYTEKDWKTVEWYEDTKLFGPIVTLISLLIGTIFYCWDNEWDMSTSFFYAVSTLFGVLFYLPVNKTWIGNLFTIFYYIYGAFFFAGVVGTYGGWLISNAPEIVAEERRKLVAEEPEDLDGDGVVGIWDRIIHIKNVIKYKLGWEYHYSKYLTFGAVFLWLVVGTIYGIFYEKWTVVSSAVFSISTMSAAANVSPQCVGDDTTNCKIGFFREMFLSVYMLIGCPLFTLALGQFAKFMIDRTIKRHEISILHTPITQEEFKYAANLYGDDPNVMSLGEFTILELLRLQRITLADLEQIKSLFLSIDENSTGQLDKPMLVTRNWMRPYGSFDEALLSSHKENSLAILFKDKDKDNIIDGNNNSNNNNNNNLIDGNNDNGLNDGNNDNDGMTYVETDSCVHMLTENDRANSLPPEITDDMYRQVELSFIKEDEELHALYYQQGGGYGPSGGNYDCDRSYHSHHSHRSSGFTPHHLQQHNNNNNNNYHRYSGKSPYCLSRYNSNDECMRDDYDRNCDDETILSHTSSIRAGIKRFGFEEYNEIVVPLAVTAILEGGIQRDDNEGE